MISPNVKSFTQCLLLLLVDFVSILGLFKQELAIPRLLFCKGLLAVTLFSFKKLLKNIHICADMLHTIIYSESLSHTLSGQFRSIFSETVHFSLHLTFLFFMDLIIVFGNLDSSRSLRCFTCNLFRQSRRLSVSTSFHLFNYFGMERNSFAQDGNTATTMFIIAREGLLELFRR